MTVKILYFASLREEMGCDGEEIDLPANITTAGELRAHLATRGGASTALCRMPHLRCAVNQVMAHWQAAVTDGDEVAFFPPVTGG